VKIQLSQVRFLSDPLIARIVQLAEYDIYIVEVIGANPIVRISPNELTSKIAEIANRSGGISGMEKISRCLVTKESQPWLSERVGTTQQCRRTRTTVVVKFMRQ
jgi:hypothetical protein